MKKFLFILLYIVVLSCIYAQTSQFRIKINDLEYTGIKQAEADSILEAIVTQFLITGKMTIVNDITSSDYYVSSTVNKEQDLYEIQMLIRETLSNRVKDVIRKKTDNLNGLLDLIYDCVNDLVDNIYRVDTYLSENEVFFNLIDPAILKKYATALVSSQETKAASSFTITPVETISKENFFKKFKMSLAAVAAGSIPLNLFDEEVNPRIFLHLNFDYTLFTTNVIMLAAYANSSYFSMEKNISESAANFMHIFIISCGASACASLPFYRPLSFHLNAGGGCAVTYFADEQYNDSTLNVGDPVVEGQFEVRYALSERLSLNLNVSYNWIMYLDMDLHNLLIGGGAAYRF